MKAKLIKIKDIKASANEGFTLIELLVVIGILAILMGIVLIAINPAHQFAMANNTARRNAVAQILSAVGQYEAEHNGALPPKLAAIAASAGTPPVPAPTAISSTGVDLCTDLIKGTVQYIPSFPQDPTNNNGVDITDCASYDSGYTISYDASKRVTVYAPGAQEGATIQVTR